jgi:hypothetical protein
LRSTTRFGSPGCRVARISAAGRSWCARTLSGRSAAPLRRRARRQTVSTASTRAARMLRPRPAVPVERPPTVEEVIDELRARLGAIHRRSQRRTPPQYSRWHIGPDHYRNGRKALAEPSEFPLRASFLESNPLAGDARCYRTRAPKLLPACYRSSAPQLDTPAKPAPCCPAVSRAFPHNERERGPFGRPNPKSGRLDLNQRPFDPQSNALPSCATPRWAGR